eukprot:gene16187-17814_t
MKNEEELRLIDEHEEDFDANDDDGDSSINETTNLIKLSSLNTREWLKFGVRSLARQCKIVDDKEKAGLIPSLFNIINANLGTGILAMPFVVRLSGYWGILTIITIGILGNYTGKKLISLLYEYAEDGTRVRVRDTYVDIGEAFWPGYGKYLVHVANFFEQFSHCALLLIMPGTIIAHVFPKTELSEGTWIFIVSLSILPTAFLRKMHQISWLSVVTVMTAVVISILVLCYSLTHHTHWNDDVMPDFDIRLIPIGIGIVVVTYSSQAYMPAIERSMRDPEIFDPLMDFAYTLVAVFKFGIGVIVFLAFTSQSDQIMTLNLPHNVFGAVVNIAVIVMSLTFYTVPMFTIFDLMENQLKMSWLEPLKDADTHLLGLKHVTPNIIFRLGLVSSTILIACSVPHFSLMMAFVGSLTGMLLVFIYPSLFYIKIRWNELTNTSVACNLSIIMFAIFSGTFGIMFSAKALYSVYNEYD